MNLGAIAPLDAEPLVRTASPLRPIMNSTSDPTIEPAVAAPA
jgi:hypothetical protein